MSKILENIKFTIDVIYEYLWPIFIVFLLLFGVYLSFKVIFIIQRKTTEKAKVKKKNLIASTFITLGAMIGTGSTIGILTSLSLLAQRGQMRLESMVIWALIGVIVMIPFAYSETLCSKVMKQSPRDYISMLLSPAMSFIYAIAFIILYVFGFVGFQFRGVDSVVSIIVSTYFDWSLTMQERLLFIIIPIIVIVTIILCTKSQEILLNSITFLMGIALIIYSLFFLVFIIKTSEHLPTYVSNMITGLRNPINMGFGIPLGMIIGMQSIVQSSEIGIGTLSMSAYELDSEPREAAKISIITILISFLISVLTTSYITSYGMNEKIIDFPTDSLNRLGLYFQTVSSVTGSFGLVILSLFTVLTILSTLLSSYYFISVLFENSETINILICFILIVGAGTLAILGYEIVFQVVNLLLFIVAAINIFALTSFAHGYWYRYKH